MPTRDTEPHDTRADGRAKIIEFTNDRLPVVRCETRTIEEIARRRDCGIRETIDDTPADLGPNPTDSGIGRQHLDDAGQAPAREVAPE